MKPNNIEELDVNKIKMPTNIDIELMKLIGTTGTGWVIYEQDLFLPPFVDLLSLDEKELDNIISYIPSFGDIFEKGRIPVAEAKKLIIKTRAYVDKCMEDSFYSDIEVFYLACKLGEFSIPESKPVNKMGISSNSFNIEIPKTNDMFYKIKNIHHVLKNNNIKWGTGYKIKTFEDYISICLLETFKKGRVFKKCDNCNLYFVPLRNTAARCDRKSPQNKNKTCKVYGKENKFENSLDENPTKRIRREVEQKYNNRLSNVLHYKIKYDKYVTYIAEFKEKADKYEEDVKNGKKTEQEYIDWLMEQKNIKFD